MRAKNSFAVTACPPNAKGVFDSGYDGSWIANSIPDYPGNELWGKRGSDVLFQFRIGNRIHVHMCDLA